MYISTRFLFFNLNTKSLKYIEVHLKKIHKYYIKYFYNKLIYYLIVGVFENFLCLKLNLLNKFKNNELNI